MDVLGSSLRGRRLLLCLTGSIAVYKSIYLVRLLKEAGADVQVLMTKGATQFIQPLTLATLSGHPVLQDTHDPRSGQWHNHVELASAADLMVLAPLSAHTLSKLVSGHCDNLLLATYLSARCPVLLAPAMDLEMYAHPSTQENLAKLREREGHWVMDAATGALASGLSGQGRMQEPEAIFDVIGSLLDEKKETLKGLRALVTVGPTHENLDPVRFVGNRSSGKMGLSLCASLLARGASVDLVLGPCSVPILSHPQLHCHKVQSARDMYNCAAELHKDCHLAIFAAAVADYRPECEKDEKIKKEKGDTLQCTFVKNPDIAKVLGEKKKTNQFHVGFSLEMGGEVAEEQAKKKLAGKNFDFIVLNVLGNKGAGFCHDTNKVSLYFKDKTAKHFELKSKREVAEDIVDAFALLYDASHYQN